MRTIALDSQILNTLQMCGRKTKMEFFQNWRPTEKAEALEKGDLMHQMYAHYYRGKRDGKTVNPQEHAILIAGAVAIAKKAAIPMNLPLAQVNEDIRVFKENVLYWQRDGWRILKVEQPFSKVIYERPDKDGKEGLRILYEGIIDAVVEIPSPFGIYIVDHKTASRRSTPFKLSNQFIGYAWALETHQVVINRIGFQKTLEAKDKYQRLYQSYEKPIIQEWIQSTIYWVHVLVNYIDTGYFPPNFTSCDKYSGCIFQQVCGSIPAIRDFKLQALYFQGEPWSPHTRDKQLEEDTDADEG